MASRNIVLIGFMGSGKSEIGRRLAEQTGRTFVDTDAIVEARGGSIPDIFAAEGEAGFRRREREAIREAVRAKHAVIATGGGAVMDPRNVEALRRRGVLVYLEVGTEELVRRLGDADGRPLLSTEEGRGASGPEPGEARARRRARIERLLEERTPAYRDAAELVIAADGREPGEVCGAIVEGLGLRSERPGVRSVRVSTPRPYDVLIGTGLLGRAAELVEDVGDVERVCLVSHPRIWRLWGRTAAKGWASKGRNVTRFTFPEGETRKTMATAERLLRFVATQGFHRTDLLVGLGGGVVGDVTGFAASTYGRGIAFVQCPTTLLGMVDAAIGGKTGVNLPEGKNLVGTFHQPLGVLSDLETLRTLPAREIRAGLAEVIKTALIADPGLGDVVLEGVEEGAEPDVWLGAVVERSAAVKASVVAADEREAGRRAILNYGHTLGHALEALAAGGRRLGPAGAMRLHHGEAISVGMVFAAWVSVGVGLAGPDLVDEHLRLLGGAGLPTEMAGVRWEDVRRYVEVDKKYAKGVRFVLLEAPGRPVVHGDVPTEVLREAMRRVRGG